MSKHKDAVAHTLTHQPHHQLQPRLRKTTARTAALANNNNQNNQVDAFQMPQLRNKRKAPDSPNKMLDKAVVKRSALGNMTNAAAPNAALAVTKKTVLEQIDNLMLENREPKVREGEREKGREG